MSMPPNAAPAAVYDGDLDVRRLGQALWRRKLWIIVPTLLATVFAAVGVNFVTPRYKSETRILYDGRENVFLRPEADKASASGTADPEIMASQVQLVLSRELAREVIGTLKLGERPEFNSLLNGVSPLKHLLISAGIVRDPSLVSAEERALEAYYDRLIAYPIEKSRVIVVEFQSADPELAARITNAVADGYLRLQQDVKQQQTRAAGEWLADKIDDLRRKASDAEAKAEEFRGKTSLFIGTNATSLSNQQLGDINARLAAARGRKSDAETRARLIREMLRRGEPIDASDVVNSERIRRLSEQRATLRALLAEQSSTLLDGHPRIKELKAQVADYDRQIRAEAEQMVRTLESDARIADQAVVDLSSVLDGLKTQAASSNQQDVQLRALDREARAQRDLLESYLARYREATARESIGAAPPEARVISRAVVSNTPYFPKKLPIVLVAMLSTLVICAGFLTTAELLRVSPPAPMAMPAPAPALMSEPGPQPAPEPVSVPPNRAAAPSHPALGIAIAAIDDHARRLRADGEAGRRVAVVGESAEVPTALAALTLARALAKDAKVVLVDLSFVPPGVTAVSSDPGAPGLSDLADNFVSFGDIITRDRLSGLHLVAAGEHMDGQGVLASARVTMALRALAQAYDHLVIDAGAMDASDLARVVRLAPRAALVVADTEDTRLRAAYDRLSSAGFAAIAVFDKTPTADAAEAA